MSERWSFEGAVRVEGTFVHAMTHGLDHGGWFWRGVAAVIFIAGGCLIVWPATVRIGAALLAATMVGAIVAHLTRLGDPIAIIIPGALMLFVVFVALREPDVPLAERMHGFGTPVDDQAAPDSRLRRTHRTFIICRPQLSPGVVPCIHQQGDRSC